MLPPNREVPGGSGESSWSSPQSGKINLPEEAIDSLAELELTEGQMFVHERLVAPLIIQFLYDALLKYEDSKDPDRVRYRQTMDKAEVIALIDNPDISYDHHSLSISDLSIIVLKNKWRWVEFLLKKFNNVSYDPAKAFDDPEAIDLLKEDFRLLDALLKQLIEARYQKYLTGIDSLTGLSNARASDRHLDGLVNEKKNFTLTFFDLDGLKALNNSLGEATVNRFLKKIGDFLAANIRSTSNLGDTVARIGGDEFCIISPNTDFKGAMVIAQRILDNLKAFPIELELSPDEILFLQNQYLAFNGKSNLDTSEKQALKLIDSFLNDITATGNKIFINSSASMGVTEYKPQDFQGKESNASGEVKNRAITAEKAVKTTSRGAVMGWRGGRLYTPQEASSLE